MASVLPAHSVEGMIGTHHSASNPRYLPFHSATVTPGTSTQNLHVNKTDKGEDNAKANEIIKGNDRLTELIEENAHLNGRYLSGSAEESTEENLILTGSIEEHTDFNRENGGNAHLTTLTEENEHFTGNVKDNAHFVSNNGENASLTGKVGENAHLTESIKGNANLTGKIEDSAHLTESIKGNVGLTGHVEDHAHLIASAVESSGDSSRSPGGSGLPVAGSGSPSDDGLPAAGSGSSSDDGLPAAGSGSSSDDGLPVVGSGSPSDDGPPATDSGLPSAGGPPVAGSGSPSDDGSPAAGSGSPGVSGPPAADRLRRSDVCRGPRCNICPWRTELHTDVSRLPFRVMARVCSAPAPVGARFGHLVCSPLTVNMPFRLRHCNETVTGGCVVMAPVTVGCYAAYKFTNDMTSS